MASTDETQTASTYITVSTGADDAPHAVEYASGDTLPAGARIGQYVIEYLVGRGGGGVVYAARHRVLGRRVAIKVLRAEMARFPVMVSRFVLEATAVNRIGHPNIVDIHEFGEVIPGIPYYVMELLNGMNLRKLLQLHGRFSPGEMLSLLEPVCKAVQAAHDAGFIHRDIKANNIVVVESTGERVVKLLDFGIAKMLQGDHAAQGLTEPGMQLGTAHNMAPEQIRCEPVDARADVYALGILMYQLLTGQYPFHSEDPRQIGLLHLQTPAPRPSALAPVPPAIDAIVLRCLEKRTDQRYSSVAELLTALHCAVGDPAAEPNELASSAIGIYVEVGARDEDGMDDGMFEDVSNVLDRVEQALADQAFAFPLRMSNAILGVRLVRDDDAGNQQTQAEGIVGNLRAMLAKRPDAHPDLFISLASSVEQSLCRKAGDRMEITGGPILEVNTWTVSQTTARVPGK